MVALVDPDDEGLFRVVEDASALRPPLVLPAVRLHLVVALEQQVVPDETLADFLRHPQQGELLAL